MNSDISILSNLLNMQAFFRDNKNPADLLFFFCDRETFFKDNKTITGHWPGMHPDLEYRAFKDGIRLFYKGAPWREMAMAEAMLKEEVSQTSNQIPQTFDPGEFNDIEMSVMTQVSKKDDKWDHLEWNQKALETGGEGSVIDFESLEKATLNPEIARKNRNIRENRIKSSESLDILKQTLPKLEKQTKPVLENYRIVNWRDPAAGIALQGIFSQYNFSLERFPSEQDRNQKLFNYPFLTNERITPCECLPECENPYMAIKIEDDYPYILASDEGFAGLETLEKAINLIKADVKDDALWLVTIHSQTWQGELYSLNAVPRVFKNPATAFKWLCENCKFSANMRLVKIFMDSINTAYVEDLPGRPGWRIMKTNII